MNLVERIEQWRIWAELLASARSGTGGIGLVTGPAGAGRTSLTRAFADHAVQQGCQVLTATGSRGELGVPLGIMGQLLNRAELPGAEASAVEDLLAAGARLSWAAPPDDTSELAGVHVLHGLCLALLRLAARSPLVIIVDDVHLADRPSLQCLSYLGRRVRNAPVLLMLSEGTKRFWQDRYVRADLARDTNCRPIPVPLLSPAGVEQVLRASFGAAGTGPAAECYALTGGNPLLLRALIEDIGDASPVTATPGERFAEAVADCLYRCRFTTSHVARALAVAGDVSTAVLGQMLGQSAEAVAHEITLLADAGLVDRGAFRHPGLRQAVLAGIEPSELTALHGTAARVRHGAGHPYAAVADHLLHAGREVAPWAAPALCEAAARALDDGKLDLTLEYLRVARTVTADDGHQSTVTALLSRAEWRRDPARAMRYLPDLLRAEGDSRSVVQCTVMAVHLLLWQGRPNEALDAIGTLFDRGDPDEQTVATAGTAILWLACFYPTHAGRVHRQWAALMRSRQGLPTKTPERQTVVTLLNSAGHGPDAESVELARGLLDRTRITDGSLPVLFTGLSILIVAGRTDLAARWCDETLAQERVRRAPTWRALVLALRAEVGLRRGDLAEARSAAEAALPAISVSGWGVALGGVLATLVMSATLAGDYADAAGYLELPLPANVLTTPFGLKYLYARGTFYLATDQVQAAVRDFQACGRAVKTWRFDVTMVVPWRLGLAQAYLALGFLRQSREQAHKQIWRLGDQRSDIRGAAMVVLAAASPPEQRLPLLEEATELLMAGNDRLAAARACADLADALRDAGEANRARAADRTARELAEECGYRSLLARLGTVKRPSVMAGRRMASLDAYGSESLSDAERRVAALAATGHTNRAIADQLYVTVSTVEQHLTRAYRKLGIRHRGELASALDEEASAVSAARCAAADA